MAHRYYPTRTGRRAQCVCGGTKVRILKNNEMRVCTRCHIGSIGKYSKRNYICAEDVPKILAETHVLNDEGDVIPVEEQ